MLQTVDAMNSPKDAIYSKCVCVCLCVCVCVCVCVCCVCVCVCLCKCLHVYVHCVATYVKNWNAACID